MKTFSTIIEAAATYAGQHPENLRELVRAAFLAGVSEILSDSVNTEQARHDAAADALATLRGLTTSVGAAHDEIDTDVDTSMDSEQRDGIVEMLRNFATRASELNTAAQGLADDLDTMEDDLNAEARSVERD